VESKLRACFQCYCFDFYKYTTFDFTIFGIYYVYSGRNASNFTLKTPGF
jgi:hypothetical protein